jgi:predicted nucleic acid-binding protein
MSILVDSAALLMMAGDNGPLPDWARKAPDEEIFLSIVSADELLRGAESAGEKERLRRLAFIEALLNQLSVVPVDESIMRVHARLATEKGGRDAGTTSWVAATALAHGCRVLTPLPEPYQSYPGVEIERWPPD